MLHKGDSLATSTELGSVAQWLSWLFKKSAEILEGRKEMFYLRLYGVRHIVDDQLDSEKGNPLPPHMLLLPISSKGSLYALPHRQDNTYHGILFRQS